MTTSFVLSPKPQFTSGIHICIFEQVYDVLNLWPSNTGMQWFLIIMIEKQNKYVIIS